MKRVLASLTTIALVAIVAVLGSIAGRAVWDTVTAEDKPKPEPPPLEVLNSEAASEKFEGELLGVYVGPPGVKPPPGYTTYEEICGDLPTVEVEGDRAGVLGLSFTLPQPFELQQGSLNTGVIACGDTVYAARWDFAATQPSGYRGGLVVARGLFKYAEFDVSSDRVDVVDIGGTPAILIEPLTESGISSAAGVIFPEASGMTVLQSTGGPRSELLKAAEIVAKAMAERSGDEGN